ncbi:MAG: signal peptidase II [Asticcacaulis sp.]
MLAKLRAHFTPLFTPQGMRGILLALLILIVDQVSKAWILMGLNLETVGRVNILPFFSFSIVHNRGISFGFLTSEGLGRWALVLFQFVVALAMMDYTRRQKSPWLVISLGLIIGGAIGNGIDRLRLGYVVDFLDFSGTGIFPWVFNVADSAITIGVALLVGYFIRADMAEKAKKAI